MTRKKYLKRLAIFLISVSIIVILAAAFGWVWYDVYSMRIRLPFWRRGNQLIVLIYALLLVLFAKMYNALKFGYLKKLDVFISWSITAICTNVIEYLLVSLIDRHLLNVRPMAALTAADIVIIAAWTWLSGWAYMRITQPRKVLIIYGKYSPDEFMRKMTRRGDKFTIGEKVHVSVGMQELCKRMRRYDAVFIWDLPAATRNDLVKFCFSHSIRCYVTPKISDIVIRGSQRMHLFDTPLLVIKNDGLSVEQKIVKRLGDILISGIGIVIASPVMLIVAVCIKAYDHGPVFYRQERLTIGAKPFKIWKFRSMVVDSEKHGAQLAKKNDSRITPVGRVIRNLHLDELPQLFNVFIGDMSIVGPRPERHEIVRKYEREIPEFHYRMKVKAGLTGYAQVYGKYNTTPYDKLKLDMFYIENFSISLDIQLMFMTFRILFQKETSEGVEDWQSSALKSDKEGYVYEDAADTQNKDVMDTRNKEAADTRNERANI